MGACEDAVTLRYNRILSKLFGWAWSRHNRQHDADYEDCCSSPVCRAAWFVERWLWYGGKHSWEIGIDD